MLLSDPKTAEFIRTNFVPTWTSIRPAPLVTIDFGNGKTMKRTLAGNTVMYVSMPDGTVVDAFPGVYLPVDFKNVAEKSLEAVRDLNTSPRKDWPKLLQNWHASQFERAQSTERARTATSKAFVESPLLDRAGLRGINPSLNSQSVGFNMTKARVQSPVLGATGLSSKLPEKPAESEFQAYGKRLDDISKRPMNSRAVLQSNAGWKGKNDEQVARELLEFDSRTNLRWVQPGIHLLLKRLNVPKISDLTRPIFLDLLHLDIDDPYLGIRETPIPGTPDH